MTMYGLPWGVRGTDSHIASFGADCYQRIVASAWGSVLSRVTLVSLGS